MIEGPTPVAASRVEKEALASRLSAPSDRLQSLLGKIALGGVVVFGLWAAFVPISSGVVASGQISVENRRKTVQHLDGGIVREIRAREGKAVGAGDLLIRMDDTEAALTVSVLQGQVDALRAEQVARQAELTGATQIRFPEDLLKRASDPDVAATLATQRAAYAARRANVVGRKSQMSERQVQIRKEIGGNIAQSASRSEQIMLLDSEIKDVQGLLDKGLTTRTRLLALQRAAAQARGDRGALDAQVAKLHAQQTETSVASMQIERESNADAADVMRQVQSELVQAIDKLAAAKSVLARTQVRAPVGGAIVGLAVTTVGGVIRPGEPLMDIVPNGGRLVVTAKVLPKDADSIRFGQSVAVRFDGGGTRTAPVLEGQVDKISADSLLDQRTGMNYFELTVSVPSNEASRLPSHLLRPGLPAEVLVRTGSRTALGYMLSPITKASFGAMRER